MLGHLPPKGGASGYRSQIANVSWRNGSSGSGAKYITSGKRRIDTSENSKGAKRAKHRRRSSSTASLISSGGLNGTKSVICAGTPAAAEGSYRSRNGFTKPSASGTNMKSADSIGDMAAA